MVHLVESPCEFGIPHHVLENTSSGVVRAHLEPGEIMLREAVRTALRHNREFVIELEHR